MSTSYTLSVKPLSRAQDGARPVLVTGAAGRIGRSLVEYAHQRYALRLLVLDGEDKKEAARYGDVLAGDLFKPEVAAAACEGIDTVVHLAADPSASAGWDPLLRNNIVATYNLFAAAVHAGCRRVVFASSIHAVSGYPQGYQVHADDPVNPGDLYGASKCFGEALARLVAVQQGVSAIVLRIGAFQPRRRARRADSVGMMNAFVSHRDLNQLVCRCVDDERLLFAVFHALSGNRFNRLDILPARELVGYAPEDDFTELNRELAELDLRKEVTPHDAKHTQGAAV